MFRRFAARVRDWLVARGWYPRLRPRADWHGPSEPPSPEIDERSLEQGLRLLEIIREQEPTLCQGSALHVALGDQPLLPLLLSIAGCRQIVVVDHQRVLDAPLLLRTAANLLRHVDLVAERLGMARTEIVARLRCSRDCTFFEALRHFRIQYVAPYDLLDGTLEHGFADLITTRSLLEAYSRPYAVAALNTLKTVLKQDGKLCLCIDQTERYGYVILLQESGWEVDVDEAHPILQVLDSQGDRPRPDPKLLNAFLIAGVRREAEQSSRG